MESKEIDSGIRRRKNRLQKAGRKLVQSCRQMKSRANIGETISCPPQALFGQNDDMGK